MHCVKSKASTFAPQKEKVANERYSLSGQCNNNTKAASDADTTYTDCNMLQTKQEVLL